MATTVNKKRLRVTELDFEEIKENLKLFLKHKQNLKTTTLMVQYEHLVRYSCLQYTLSRIQC